MKGAPKYHVNLQYPEGDPHIRSTFGPAPEDEQWPAMQQRSDEHSNSEAYVTSGPGAAYMNDLLTFS